VPITEPGQPLCDDRHSVVDVGGKEQGEHQFKSGRVNHYSSQVVVIDSLGEQFVEDVAGRITGRLGF
jgi:hypothetical protein